MIVINIRQARNWQLNIGQQKTDNLIMQQKYDSCRTAGKHLMMQQEYDSWASGSRKLTTWSCSKNMATEHLASRKLTTEERASRKLNFSQAIWNRSNCAKFNNIILFTLPRTKSDTWGYNTYWRRSVKPSTKSKWYPDFMSYRLQCTQQFQRKNLADGRRGTCRVEKQVYLFKQAESELVARDLYTASTVHIIQAKQNCVMGVIGGGDWEGWNYR